MYPKIATLTLFLSIVTHLTSAHFVLTYPPPLGFNDDNEALSPCGGFDVTFNNKTTPSMNITVGGFSIAMQSTRPQANWLFRATLDQKEPFMWTNLMPVVAQTSIGQFCAPMLSAPKEFAGQMGLVQVVQESAGDVVYEASHTSSIHYPFYHPDSKQTDEIRAL